MNLYEDESLKQEVIYLHSLWHQGPPARNTIPSSHLNPIHDQFPRSRPNYIPPTDLHLLSRYGALNPNQAQNLYNNKRSRPDWGGDWPVNDSKSHKKARPIPEDEKARFAAYMLQRDIHRICRDFFGKEDTEGEEGQGSSCSKEVHFLTKLFEEKEKLKEYYVKNSGNVNGEFWCLVCGGTGDKSCRKFKSCLALIQHSLNISKTDLKSQHRALAEVICSVVGWDVNNPVISSQKVNSQTTDETVVECATEPPSDSKKPQVMTVKEQAKAALLQMQQSASEALKGLFVEETEIEENSDDENLSEKLELISKAFSENVELKSYYEKNFEGGVFICLVCYGATDKKMIKRFKHCHGLVQHSTTRVPKLQKLAHKAFAQFVCQLVGWEFDSLPCRVVKADAPLVEDNANNEKPSSVVEEHMCEDKAGSPPVESDPTNDNNEKPSSVVEDNMCEDKADITQDNNEACVGQ